MIRFVINCLRNLGRSALWLIALMLFASAIIRFGTGPAIAIANDLNTQQDEPPEETQRDLAGDLAALLEDVQARERALSEKEAALEARMQVLALIEEEVKRDIARLEAAEAELRSTLATADKAAETDIARLTAVYENMKTEQAAALFQRMEPIFAAGFLGRMRSDAAAAILAGLEPDLAYSISVVLAGRNANVVREPVSE